MRGYKKEGGNLREEWTYQDLINDAISRMDGYGMDLEDAIEVTLIQTDGYVLLKKEHKDIGDFATDVTRERISRIARMMKR
jgi:hypothetical protein